MSTLAAPFRPLLRSDTYRALLFLVASLPIGAAALALLIAGWVGTGVLLVTPLVVAALVAFRGATGLLATADAALARALLGASARPRTGSGGTGYWRRAWAVATDEAFWKQQVYLALRLTLGFALAVGELSLIAAAFGALAFPITYRWSDLHLWSWQVDTLARSLVLVPAGIVGLVAAAWLAGLLGAAWGRVVDVLLADRSPSSGAAAGARAPLSAYGTAARARRPCRPGRRRLVRSCCSSGR